jgi:hypothetical protein
MIVGLKEVGTFLSQFNISCLAGRYKSRPKEGIVFSGIHEVEAYTVFSINGH